MTPEQLTGLLDGLATAADVVEAIDDPGLRGRRGWDLAGWSYDLVPWGVRFVRREAPGQDGAEVLAVLSLQADRARPAPGTVLLFG